MKHKQIRSIVKLMSNGTLDAVFLKKNIFMVVNRSVYLDFEIYDILSKYAKELIENRIGYVIHYEGDGCYRLFKVPKPDDVPF